MYKLHKGGDNFSHNMVTNRKEVGKFAKKNWNFFLRIVISLLSKSGLNFVDFACLVNVVTITTWVKVTQLSLKKWRTLLWSSMFSTWKTLTTGVSFSNRTLNKNWLPFSGPIRFSKCSNLYNWIKQKFSPKWLSFSWPSTFSKLSIH